MALKRQYILNVLAVLSKVVKIDKSFCRRTFQGNCPRGKDLPWNGVLNYVSINFLRMPN